MKGTDALHQEGPACKFGPKLKRKNPGLLKARGLRGTYPPAQIAAERPSYRTTRELARSRPGVTGPRKKVGASLEASEFHVADAATILRIDPIALLYVATVLAQRLDSANRGLLELKHQVQGDEPRSVIWSSFEKIERLTGATGANLMYGT